MSKVGTISEDHGTVRARAEADERELSVITARFRNLDPTHPHHIHYLFAELYLCTTRCWLARLAERDDSEYAYRVICHFLALYRAHVLSGLEEPLANVARHWRRYHRLARRQSIRSPIFSHLILISVGARAHTHGDLGQAMYSAKTDMGDGPKGARKPFEERQRIFGRISDDAFYHAAIDYVEVQHARQTGWRRAVLALYRIGLIVLKPVWLSVFQRWRRTGYAQAAAQASSSRHFGRSS